ncbi:hypothetical protein BDV32DRAFT_125024 [Aspergillus pseudonomiae]|nr:hypothetical protein BDV32DRAFT_125024 [Aspergillus pseudonomiae]
MGAGTASTLQRCGRAIILMRPGCWSAYPLVTAMISVKAFGSLFFLFHCSTFSLRHRYERAPSNRISRPDQWPGRHSQAQRLILNGDRRLLAFWGYTVKAGTLES